MTYQPQHFLSPEGVSLVVIRKDEFDRLSALDRSEDAHDLADARRSLADDTRYPAPVVDAMLRGATPVAAWRRYRNLTQAALAQAARMSQAGIARLERDASAVGRRATREALATALRIPVSALEPLA